MSSRPHGWGRGSTRNPLDPRTRAHVLERDHYLCQVRWDSDCTLHATQVDHIKLKADDGSDDPVNLRGSCSSCNAKRNYALRPRPRTARRPIEPPPGLIDS